MHNIPITRNRFFSLISTVATVLVLGGCYNVEYKYDIPTDASDCPTGMDLRSGGSGIVDRSGGSGIVDRDGNAVMSYCFVPNCPGGIYDNTVPAEIDWHLDDHREIVAQRTCLALPAAQSSGGTSGGSGSGSGLPTNTGGSQSNDDEPNDGS